MYLSICIDQIVIICMSVILCVLLTTDTHIVDVQVDIPIVQVIIYNIVGVLKHLDL
jgi:hypothetical protein